MGKFRQVSTGNPRLQVFIHIFIVSCLACINLVCFPQSSFGIFLFVPLSNFFIWKLKNLNIYFLKNGYPWKIVNACIQKFLKKISTEKVILHTVPKREYFIILPYLGPLSNKIQKRIKTVFQELIPAGKIKIVFKTQRRISHFLRFKDIVPSFLDSHIIYHFKCPSCNAGYVGETCVNHKVRSSQHLGISEWTGKPSKGGVPTSVTNHIKASNCICNLEDFSIIGRETDYHLRLLKESLFIKLYDYKLNERRTSTELFLF